nr:hypothetical protein [Tanacetum cinerariifolium]
QNQRDLSRDIPPDIVDILRDDWDHFNPPTIDVSLVPVAAAPRAIDLADLSVKKDEFGRVRKNKARLVAQEFRQEEGIDFEEPFAPICPKILGHEFEDLPLEHDILYFIIDIWHTRDTTYLTDMNVDYLHQPWRAFATVINKCLSRKEYGMDKIRLSCAQIIWELTNQAMVESKAYKTYYGFVSGEKTPKPKYVKKKADSATSTKQKPVQATKGTKIKTKDKVVKSDKKKQPAKKPKAKGLAVLFEGDSDEEDDDENDFEDDADNNNNDSDDNDESDDERTETDRDEIPEPNLTNVDHTEHEEEYVDKRAHTYSNYDLTDDEKIHDEENVNEEEEDEVTKELKKNASRQLGFKQEEEDAHVTLRPILEAQKTRGATQRSSVFFEFTSKLLNLDNPSPANNEIASLMDTTAYHPTLIPKITSSFTTPTLPPPSFFNPLSQQATPTPTPTASETTTSLFILLDFSSYEEGATLFEFELTNILIDKLEKNKSFDVADYKRELYDALIKSYSTDKYIFESYGEVFSLKRSQDDKDKDQDASAGSDRGTKRRKSSNDAESSRDSRRRIIAVTRLKIMKKYDYGHLEEIEVRRDDQQLYAFKEVFSLKRSQDDKDKDQDASAGSDRGTKRRKSSNDAESSRDSRSKEKKSLSTSKDTSYSRHKSFDNSAHAEEPSHTAEDLGMQQDHKFVMGENDEQPTDKEVTKSDWFK